MVCSRFVLKQPRAKKSTVSTNIASGTSPTYPRTLIFIPQNPEPYLKTRSTSACDVPVGAHNLSSSVSDQSTSNHVNYDVYNNDDSQSFKTPRKYNHSYTSFGDTKNTTNTPVTLKYYLCYYQHFFSKIPNLSNLPPPEK